MSAKLYPSDSATADQLLRLAEEYRKAAERLRRQGRRGNAFSRAPGRLSAIHAIELYLDAFLLRAGNPASDIRAMNHDLRNRAELVKDLKLKKRTEIHLSKMSERREYTAVRYNTEMTADISPPNLLEATLKEIAEKVKKHLKPRRTQTGAVKAKVPLPSAG